MSAPLNATYGLRIASIDAALRLAGIAKQGGRPQRAGDVVANAKIFLTYLERGQ